MNRTTRHLREWWPWGAALVLGLAVVSLVARMLVDHQLKDNAAEEARNWTALLQTSAPELVNEVAQGELSPSTRQRLAILAGADEVFRLRIVDRQARTLYDSQPSRHARDAGTEAPQTAHAAIATGQAQIDVFHHAQGVAEHFSRAMVPLDVAGRAVGAVELHIDQSERAEGIERGFLLLCGLVVALTCTIAGTAAWRAWRQWRAQLQTEERVRYLASHDALSGTLNRSSFVDVLQAAAWRRQGGGPGFAVLCIDLDRFKEVNDGHGHAAGDEVLRAVGDRLRSVLRHVDAVARLGGDEFAVMQAGVSSPADAARLAERIVAVLGEPFEVSGVHLRCGGSVGVALFVAGVEPAQLLKQADAALYQAKSMGRGRFCFYDAQVDGAAQDRRDLARDLRGALDAGQMRLAFQPLYAGDGERLRGYEALMRWDHPTRGPVSPGLFIPMAEEGGLIGELGTWALQQACREAATWPGELSVAVNLSAAQFEGGNLVAAVRQALHDSGLGAHRVELEITESLLINNTQQVLGTLGELSAMGVRIAMDDFGTGYSSLAYLWRFPFDRIKIDRAFVKDIADDPKAVLIVKSIIDLAHAMRIRVTGEGVETPAQLQMLARHGCDEVQGFLLGRPAAADQLAHGSPSAAPGAGGLQPDVALVG